MRKWLPVAAFVLTLGVGRTGTAVAAPPTTTGNQAFQVSTTPAKAPTLLPVVEPARSTSPRAGDPRAPQLAQMPPASPSTTPVPPATPKPPALAKKLPPALSRVTRPATVVATVNGETITMRQLLQQLTLLGGPQVLDRMIQERILRQEVRKHGIVVTEKEVQERLDQNLKEFKARFGTPARYEEYLQRQRRTEETLRDLMRPNVETALLQEKLREKVTASVTVTDEEIAEFYETQKVLFTEPETAKVSHILVTVPSGDAEADQKAKARAEEILAKVKAEDGKNFAEIAREMSDDAETKEKGGEMVPLRRPTFYGLQFDQALFSASPGVIPEVVRSIRGWHVLLLHEKTPSRVRPVEEVKETIQNQLLTRKRAERYRTYMQEAEKNARTDVKLQF